MSGSNHIVGGVVFTGIYLSMWDLNIFSQPAFLFFTAFFAVLADIDHTKSPIGKMFYPVAKYLDRNYGHRTITHSLLCYFILILLTGIIENIISSKSIITAIAIWSYGSHLIFDMVTKQGVPLFYPFKKNPCVIPANPDFRLRSSEMKTEATLFVLFIFLGFSCRNLFQFGFWNTYNKTFNNIKHVNNEVRLYDGVINVKYEIKKDGIAKKGNGKIIEATDNNILIFDNEIIDINENDRILNLFPIRTKEHLITHELQFANINFDSLRNLISNKIIRVLKISATLPISYTKENSPQSGLNFELKNVYRPILSSNNIDSIDTQTEKEIQLLNEEIAINTQQEINNNIIERQKQNKKNETLKRLTELEKDLSSTELEIKEKAVKDYQKVKTEYEQLSSETTLKTSTANSLQIRLNYLKNKLHIKKNQTINGYIMYITFK